MRMRHSPGGEGGREGGKQSASCSDRRSPPSFLGRLGRRQAHAEPTTYKYLYGLSGALTGSGVCCCWTGGGAAPGGGGPPSAELLLPSPRRCGRGRSPCPRSFGPKCPALRKLLPCVEVAVYRGARRPHPQAPALAPPPRTAGTSNGRRCRTTSIITTGHLWMQSGEWRRVQVEWRVCRWRGRRSTLAPGQGSATGRRRL